MKPTNLLNTISKVIRLIFQSEFWWPLVGVKTANFTKLFANYSFFRIPFLELGIIKPKHTMCEKPDFDKTEKNEENVLKFMSHSLDFVLSLKRPRIIKTHLPIELLPKKLLDTGKVRNLHKSRKENLNKSSEHMSANI